PTPLLSPRRRRPADLTSATTAASVSACVPTKMSLPRDPVEGDTCTLQDASAQSRSQARLAVPCALLHPRAAAAEPAPPAASSHKAPLILAGMSRMPSSSDGMRGVAARNPESTEAARATVAAAWTVPPPPPPVFDARTALPDLAAAA
ncbi:unnamed protein product, partial [Ectocarpus sp. 13 AM-2016]